MKQLLAVAVFKNNIYVPVNHITVTIVKYLFILFHVSANLFVQKACSITMNTIIYFALSPTAIFHKYLLALKFVVFCI